MKKILCGILSVVLMLGVLCPPAGAQDETFIEGDFRCKIVHDAVSIVEFVGEDGKEVDVVVPETIQGYTVKYIGQCAFGDLITDRPSAYTFRSITLPDTVEAIAYGAFADSGARVNLPANLKYVGHEAYGTCPIAETSNQRVVLPQGIEYIGSRAFLSVSEFYVPDGLIYMAYEAFGYRQITLYGNHGIYAQQYCDATRDYYFQPTRYCMGDVDHSGSVDVADILALKADIVREQCRDAALSDVDGDGAVTVGDILCIKDQIVYPKRATMEWRNSVDDLLMDISL